jgi:hypothetical protein
VFVSGMGVNSEVVSRVRECRSVRRSENGSQTPRYHHTKVYLPYASLLPTCIHLSSILSEQTSNSLGIQYSVGNGLKEVSKGSVASMFE